MEHCAGSLFQFIQTKRLSTVFSGNRQKTRTFQKNIIEGIEFLHKKMNMVHRDIKPSNILIFENHNELIPKIADYGISEVVKHDGKGGAISTQYFRGTDGWKAPELRAYASYSKAVDIFAAGCLLFYIETEGCHPFAGHARVMGSEVQRNIDDFAPNIGSLLKIEPTILDLICRALEKDEKKRSTATEILSHPTFFSNEEAMNYIRRVAEQGKQKMETFFEKLDPSFKLVIIKNDWRSVLDGEVFKEAQMGPQRKPIRSFEEEKYGQSLSNLLSLIRNKVVFFFCLNHVNIVCF